MQVGARTAAVVAGALVALVVGVMFCVREVPDRVVSLLGGPKGGVERLGGVRLIYEPPPGSDMQAGPLEYPGLAIDDVTVDSLVDTLVAGGLSMKRALETEWALRIAQHNRFVDEDYRQRDPEAEPRAVRLEIDYWRDDDGNTHQPFTLEGDSTAALDAAIADARNRGVELPPNTQIAYERFEPLPEARHRKPFYRAYLLDSTPAVDGTMIASAVGAFEPNTGRPVVLLDFTPAGGDRFCEITRDMAGHKLATMLGGAVRSAPIINGPICGGRASITMGGSDPDRQLRDRDMLVEVLSHGALPPGGKVRDLERLPPAKPALQEMLGRILLGLLAGLAAALITFFVVRFARPSAPQRTHGFAGLSWKRLAITLLAPLVLIIGKRLIMPGVNEYELEHVMRGANLESFSVIALGLTPVLLAYFLVELVALIVPALRWRRHDPQGRIALGRATAVLAILLALAHAYFVVRALESASAFGGDFIDSPGLKFRLIAMLSLVAGTLILAAIAGVISEHGLGNGYGVVLASAILLDLIPDLDIVELDAHLALGFVAFTAMVIASMAVLRWRVAAGREPALRIPTSGISPLADSGAFVSLVFALTGLAANATLFDLVLWSQKLSEGKVRLALIAITVPVWAWIFARPSLVRIAGGIDRSTRETWIRATAVSALLLVGIGIITLAMPAMPAPLLVWISPLNALLFAAVLLDVIGDAKARGSKLAVAGVVHQPQYLGAIEHVLAEATIPYHLHASHLRSLFAFFGPWAPVLVLVPDDHAIEARLKIDEIVRPPRGRVPAARTR